MVDALLRSLPEWFGIESSIVDYVAEAAHLPTYLAWSAKSPARSPARSPATSPARPPATSPATSPARPPATSPATSPARWPAKARDRSGDDSPVGVLLAARHFPGAAEIYLMAVARSAHRSGVGRALVAALERDLVREGVKFLQVKTLGPTHPDPGYINTRQFYEAIGFAPLEENLDLWPDNPCLIMIKALQAKSA